MRLRGVAQQRLYLRGTKVARVHLHNHAAFTIHSQFVRALACEAFYSDFVAPGAEGPGAWEEIDFRFPIADRINKDWSYLGVQL